MKLEKILAWTSNLMAIGGFVIILCAVGADDFYTMTYMPHSFTNMILQIVFGLLMFVPKIIDMIIEYWEE